MSMNKLERLQLEINQESDPEIRAKLKQELGDLILEHKALIEEEKRLEAHRVEVAIASNI